MNNQTHTTMLYTRVGNVKLFYKRPYVYTTLGFVSDVLSLQPAFKELWSSKSIECNGNFQFTVILRYI